MTKLIVSIAAGWLLLLVGICTAQPNSISMSASISLSSRFAYIFDCAGHYVKLDLETHKVLLTATVPTIDTAAGRVDGCLIDSLRIDADKGLLYGVLANENRVDGEGRRHYRVVAFELSTLNQVSTLQIPFALDLPPSIVFDPANSQLLVSYRGESSNPTMLRYALPDLRRARVAPSIQAPVQQSLLSSRNPHVDRVGRIVDGDRILDPHSGIVKHIDGYSLLDGGVKHKLRDLERTGVLGRPYLDSSFADSAAGRMLFIVGWDTPGRLATRSGFIVYDAIDEKVLGFSATLYSGAPFDGVLGTPTMHLTPDGKLVVIEKYEWHTVPSESMSSPSLQVRFKTGEIAIYSADTGDFIRTVQVADPVPGAFANVVGFSADNTILFYTSRTHLYAVDLTGSQTSWSVAAPEGFLATTVVMSKQ